MNYELEFEKGNPGAVKHGNFINYYSFHSPEARIECLPQDVWSLCDNSDKFHALDVGCNAGDLTILIHEFLKNKTRKVCRTLGLDIDPILIRRAKENYGNFVSFDTVNFMDETERNRSITSFLNETRTFDAVFCFSVTMWIHLNNGDEGLKRFLQHVCRISKLLIIEPQPWKCYRQAVKRVKDKSVFPKFTELRIRGNVECEIENIIRETGFGKVWESDRVDWGRKVLCFKKLNLN